MGIGDANPVVVSICDCTDHISEGGKKDATYIAEISQENVNEFDPDGRNMDVFFFDSASNVQEEGQFCAKFFPGHIAFMMASMSSAIY